MIPHPSNGGTACMIAATFGRSHTEVRWSDQREMSFDDFAKMFSSASVGPKNGTCFTPAIFRGSARRMDQADRIDVAVLDADCGHNLSEIKKAVIGKEWMAIIHSTHSHMTDTTIIAAAPAEKWLADNQGRAISDYMLEKKGYLPRIVEGAAVVDEARDGNIRNLIVRHKPCPKFRVILPLEKPWQAADFQDQNAANTRWRERIGALAHALGLAHDQSCVDTSRLFYFPRIKTVQSPFEFEIITGTQCPLFDLPDATPETSLFSAPVLPVTSPLQLVRQDHKQAVSPHGEFIDLTVWAAKYASRFQAVDAISAKAPGILTPRRNGVKRHIICPNAAGHITSGADKEGTYAVNASDLPQANLPSISSGFVIHCMHAGCAGLDRLDHLRAMLRDGTLEVSDLTDDRFLLPELPLVDVSRLVANAKARHDVHEAQHSPSEKHPNIPASLYANLPPVMREMHDYMTATAVKPQPALALGSLLAFFGAAIGRKAELAGVKVRANIYALGVAHSGAGKERLLSSVKDTASAAGLYDRLIGIEEVASDAGIVNAIIRQPNQVMLLDEISYLIGATHNTRAGLHIVNVTSTLLKLYSSSRTRFKGKSYADTDKIQSVDQPCVSIFGCSTPAGLFSALSSKDVSNGLLSRFVLFDAGSNDPIGTEPADIPPPKIVIDWLRAWDSRPENENPIEMVGMQPVIRPLQVIMTEDAKSISQAFEVEMHSKKIMAREGGTDALYVRARENALKFALVAACSFPPIDVEGTPAIDQTRLIVTADIMRWACELSRVTITAMEKGAREEMADSQFQQKMVALRRDIEKAGAKGLTQYELRRLPSGKMPDRELREVMQALCDSGDVTYTQDVNKGKTRGGRPRAAFIHKSFDHSPIESDK